MRAAYSHFDLLSWVYDRYGNRLSQSGSGGVTTYYYWGIGEKVSGSWTKLYVSGLGGKLVEYTSSSTQFFVTNHLGSVAARMTMSGALSETYRFLPFGERYAGTQTTHQFTGKERDPESGLDYFGARYLASSHGRWMSVDPKLGDRSNPQRLNRYGYVLNNPTYYFDPNGRQEQAIDEGDMKNCHRDETGKMNCDSGMTVTGEFDRVDPMPSSIGTWAPGGSGFQGAFVGSPGSSSAPGGQSGGTATPVDSPVSDEDDFVLCVGVGGSGTIPGSPVTLSVDGVLQQCFTSEAFLEVISSGSLPSLVAALAGQQLLGNTQFTPCIQGTGGVGTAYTVGPTFTWSPADSPEQFASGLGIQGTLCGGLLVGGCISGLGSINSDGEGGWTFSFNGLEIQIGVAFGLAGGAAGFGGLGAGFCP